MASEAQVIDPGLAVRRESSRLSALRSVLFNPLPYLAVCAITLTAKAAPGRFMSCLVPCGDIYQAYSAAQNIVRFGWHWAGLEDYATSSHPEAHPYLYMHHGNLGIYVSYLFDLVHVNSIFIQNASGLIPFLLGLYFGYRFFCDLSGHRWPGVVFLLLACFDYITTGVWAFNILWAWGYFCFFGLLWLVHRRSITNEPRLLNYLGIFCLAFMSLFVDYMYFSFLLFAVLLYRPIVIGQLKPLREYPTMLAPFIAAFFARQLQSLIGAGWFVWSRDFFIQFTNRTGTQAIYQGDWAGLGQLYHYYHVENPGNTGIISWSERLSSVVGTTGGFVDSVLTGGFIRNGEPYVLAAGLFVGLALPALLWALQSKQGSRPTAMAGHKGRPGAHLLPFSLLLIVSILIELMVFPSYFSIKFGGGNIGTICVLCWLTVAISCLICLSKPSIRVGAALLIIGVTLRVLVLSYGFRSVTLGLNDYRDVLPSLQGYRVLSSFTPAFVASFTHDFSATITPKAMLELPQRKQLTRSDYFFLTERDESNPAYYQPDYLFYCFGCPSVAPGALPTDQIIQAYIDEGVPLVARGDAYVLFDLRGLWAGRPAVGPVDAPMPPILRERSFMDDLHTVLAGELPSAMGWRH